MRVKNFKSFLLLTASVPALVFSSCTVEAATVTVDPNATEVPGSVYKFIESAMGNAFANDSWADGNDDTILLVTTAGHSIPRDINLAAFTASSTMTIKSVGPQPAICYVKQFDTKYRMFSMEASGNYVFENLTCIGAKNVDGFANDYRTCFRIEPDDAGEVINCIIRNCVVTANDGSDQPVRDYLKPFPANNEGTFMRAIYSGDDRYRGRVSVLAENCVFAFLSNQSGATVGGVELSRPPEPDNPFLPNPTREFVFKNCLFAGALNDAIQVNGAGEETTITLEDCAFTGNGGRGLFFSFFNATGPEDQKPTINITHCIFDTTAAPIGLVSKAFYGTLNIDELTAKAPAQDMISFATHEDGTATINLSNIIAFGVNSILRLGPDPSANSGPEPFDLTAASIATDNAVVNTQATFVQNVLNAAVVSTEDPQYILDAFDTTLVGVRKWDSKDNAFFDVGNPNYTGLATGGGDLAGGAEFGAPPPPIPASTVEEWTLYR